MMSACESGLICGKTYNTYGRESSRNVLESMHSKIQQKRSLNTWQKLIWHTCPCLHLGKWYVSYSGVGGWITLLYKSVCQRRNSNRLEGMQAYKLAWTHSTHRLSSVPRKGGFSNTGLCQRQSEQIKSLKNWLSKGGRESSTRGRFWGTDNTIFPCGFGISFMIAPSSQRTWNRSVFERDAVSQ